MSFLTHAQKPPPPPKNPEVGFHNQPQVFQSILKHSSLRLTTDLTLVETFLIH